jgi:ferric-dicitrate binding protein FerR (iron transport regulator)
MTKNVTPPCADRRRFLGVLAGSMGLLGRTAVSAAAANPVGNVTAVNGTATAIRAADQHHLRLGSNVMVQDIVKTGDNSSLAMLFGDKTSIRLGELTELLIDEYLVDIRGTFDLSRGAMVFDRPEDLPKTATTIKTVFGQLGVRGTRFFAGPSRGVFGVFVQRGRLEVSAGGVDRLLLSGDGVDIPGPGMPPTEIRRWPQARIDEAFSSVGPN